MADRIDSASRTIRASPQAIFNAFVDPEIIAQWRPPTGMHAEIYSFDPRPGGGYRMAFIYDDPSGNPGKSNPDRDVFTGHFLELITARRLVEEIAFESDHGIFSGPMRIATTLTPVEGGTEVKVEATNIPVGISSEDHRQGMESSLANLAAFLE